MKPVLARARAILAACAMAVWACEDVTDIQRLEVADAGVLLGVAFLDMNGNGGLDAGDQPLTGTTVVLGSTGSQDTLIAVSTDANGVFVMTDVPLGTHRLILGSDILGDSLTPLDAGTSVTVAFGDTLQRSLGASYPTLTVVEVRAAAAGRRVFTQGIALNTRVSNGDGVVHIQEGAASLRTTNVPPVGLAANDSVRLLGRTALDNGQPILDQVTPFLLRQNAGFITPPLITLAEADGAGGGSLDAALVRVGPAEIGDTTTVNGHLRFWAHDGADSLEVELRNFLLISPNPPIRPDTVVRVLRVTGLLVPYTDPSGTRWRLLPRAQADVVTENKVADISLAAAFAPTTASLGDTVEIRVVARNLATHTATGVMVTNRISSRLTFLTATVTRGTYTEPTGGWSIGDLAPGAADTLWISASVVGPGPTVPDTARFSGLTREVEATASNNTAVANLTVF